MYQPKMFHKNSNQSELLNQLKSHHLKTTLLSILQQLHKSKMSNNLTLTSSKINHRWTLISFNLINHLPTPNQAQLISLMNLVAHLDPQTKKLKLIKNLRFNLMLHQTSLQMITFNLMLENRITRLTSMRPKNKKPLHKAVMIRIYKISLSFEKLVLVSILLKL